MMKVFYPSFFSKKLAGFGTESLNKKFLQSISKNAYLKGYDEGVALKLPQGESIPLDPIIATLCVAFIKVEEYKTKSHYESFLPSFFPKKLVGRGTRSRNKKFLQSVSKSAYPKNLVLGTAWDSVPNPAKGNNSLWNPTIAMLRIAYCIKFKTSMRRSPMMEVFCPIFFQKSWQGLGQSPRNKKFFA